MKSIMLAAIICVLFSNCSNDEPSPCGDIEQNIKKTTTKVTIRVYELPEGSNPVLTVEVKSLNSIKRLSRSHFLNNELNYTLDFAEKGQTYDMTLSMCDGSTSGTYSLFFSYEGRVGIFDHKAIGTTNQFTVPL